MHILPDDKESRLHTEALIKEILNQTNFPHPNVTFTRVKIFESTPHGTMGVEKFYPIPVCSQTRYSQEVLYSVMQFQDDHPSILNPNIGICSTFIDCQTGVKWQLPMIDLEIDSSPDTEADLIQIADKLLSIGLTGFFIRSGDVGKNKGSYHFISDQLYRVELHTLVGLILTSLSEEELKNGENAIAIGGLLLEASTEEEIQYLGRKLMETFPSLDSGVRREGLPFDPRHLAHALVDNDTIVLRTTSKEGYRVSPVLVAELY